MNIKRKTWVEFRSTGLLWWINTILHTFGWAIVLELDDNNECVDCYPARVKFRGFSEEANTVGYQHISSYMKENANILYQESLDD